MKSIKLKEDTEKLFKKAKLKFLNLNPDDKDTDDAIIRDALKKYLRE